MRTNNFFAFDLGAESGRCFVAKYSAGVLSIKQVSRFPNQVKALNGELHWDVNRLWSDMQRGLLSLQTYGIHTLDGIGVDTWGLDYALLDRNGDLVEEPFHYRDSRTDGLIETVCDLVPASDIYVQTGIQFMQINTLYQLFAAARQCPERLQRARSLLMIPDLFNYWLTGALSCEYTCATTTQFFDLNRQDWAFSLLERLGIPTHFLLPVVAPGTRLGALRRDLLTGSGLADASVFVSAGHDTAAAVAATPLEGNTAYISSGTWSLLGAELPSPLTGDTVRMYNFTNEGGVCGTIRLLKNIAGLWLLQSCRKQWEKESQPISYSDLVALARAAKPFQALIDPDDPSFLHPRNMIETISEYCERTDQLSPTTPGAVARTILESLALKYRYVLEKLEQVTGVRYTRLRIVGGGAQNTLLNRFTADATGRLVLAGPLEATVLGNIAVQMFGTGVVSSLVEARNVIDQSFPPQSYEPGDPNSWDIAYAKFRSLVN